MRVYIFKNNYSTLDLGLGIGAFAFILQFYNKIDLNHTIPVFFLMFFFISSLYQFKFRYIKSLKFNSNRYFEFLILLLFFVYLAEFGIYDGLLEYTTDFDSSFHHIVLAQTMVREGHYFPPFWLRAPFIPQLTHSIYIFILSIFKNDILYIKLLNFIAFYQIFKIFLNRKRNLDFWLGGLILLIIVFSPEFTYLYNTNLDALLGLFYLCSLVMFYRCLRNEFSITNVSMLIVFCGFAGGQKHFGLMFSVPVILFSFFGSLIYFYKQELIGKSIKDAIASCIYNQRFYGYAISFLSFFVVFIPFYIHNLLANSNLFFPFMGNKVNAYGWSKQEIEDFTGPTINHWGHQKSVTGFFQLPYDLINFPDDFQFFQTNTWHDYVVPFLFIFPIFLLFITIVFKSTKKHLLLSIVLICCYVLWFQSSQVIRYLFPINIGSLFLIYIQFSNFKNLHTKFALNFLKIAFLTFFIYLSLENFKEVNFILPSNSNERLIYRKFQFGSMIEGNIKITQSNNNSGVLEFGPHAVMARSLFPNLTFCGDWFGGCAFEKFTLRNTPMQFKSWEEIKKASQFMKIDFISIYWTQFRDGSAPATELEYNLVFPESVRKCIEPFYKVSGEYDIFSIKNECK
ncbi:MAG: hypothetical protein SH817_12490 [Leptospira sp.]|nr:hypothetical protein [Leptospira sp.]